MSQENFESDIEFEIELEQSLDQPLSHKKYEDLQMQNLEIQSSSPCDLLDLAERDQALKELEDEGYSDEEKLETGLNLNRLCLLDSRTLRDALDGAESVQKESDMQEEITEEEELYIQDSPEEKIVQKDYKFKLDLNFGFKDDLLAESERDLLNNLQSPCSEIPLAGDLNNSASQRQGDLEEFRQAELASQAVMPKVAGQLQVVKRNAEKMRKESFVASISSEPNLKDVKPKVQSFNTNYLKPKFLKQKSRDVSQSSVRTRSRPGSTLDLADSVAKKQKEERPPLCPSLCAKPNITIEVSQQKKPKAQDSLVKQQRPISSGYNSIKNLRTKYSTITSDPVQPRIVQPQLKEHEPLGVIKMKFKTDEGASISKYKQKRQSVVEINRLQLKLSQPVAKPHVGFESPQHSVKQISPQPHKISIATKPSEQKKQHESSKKVERQQTATEISNIHKEEEQNYESGEDRSIICLNEKYQVTKSNSTKLDTALNFTVESLVKPSVLDGKPLAKVASFGNKETLVQMEQTFKPGAKAIEQPKEKTEQRDDFFKSNTYLKMTNENNQFSSFNTISVQTGRDSALQLSFVPRAFSSLKVDKPQIKQHQQRSIIANSKLHLSTSNIQGGQSNVCSRRSTVSQKSSCIQLAPTSFESEQLEYLKVIQDLRSLISKPQLHTHQQNAFNVVSRDSQNQTTEPSDSKSAKSANKNKPVNSADTKQRLMFDLRLKNEIKEIQLHLQDSSRSSTDIRSRAKWLQQQLEAQKRKNDRTEREIRKVQEIKKLLV